MKPSVLREKEIDRDSSIVNRQSSIVNSPRILCPSCRVEIGPLEIVEAGNRQCAACGYCVEFTDGILRALLPERREFYQRFLKEYSSIRNAEERGSENDDYYLGLPFADLTGKHSGQWFIRGRSYRYLEERLLPELAGARALDILDLGAGNGWLSYRLSLKGHRSVATDIRIDPKDGLAASRHYVKRLGKGFPLVEAEFDLLPFSDAQFDLAVFNSSFHYSTSYLHTLTEARRVLRPSGRIVILDSPLYRRAEHGDKMRMEKHREFETRYGFRSDSIPSIEFLHEAALEELAACLDLRWQIHRPWYGWSWHLRPWKARLKGRRPPASFRILVGTWEMRS